MGVEVARLVQEGRASLIPLDEGKATYEPPCNGDLTYVDWEAPGPTDPQADPRQQSATG